MVEKTTKAYHRDIDRNRGSVEVFHDSDGQLLGIFYQDVEMQRLVAAFPEIIFVDATYKLNDRRMPLYIMMVEDSLGQTEVVAICLVNSEENPVLQQMIKCFKTNNPVFTQTKIILADKDINERDVFRQEISNLLLLIFQFHVLRYFNREITTEKMVISAAQRHTALELLQKLVYSSTEKVYENVLAQIQETCPRQIYSYIMSNWNDIKAEWILGLKLCEGSLLNTTNNRLESFNQKLKQVVKLYSCLDAFFEQFIGLINTLRNERDYKGSNDIQKVRVTSDSVDKKCTSSCSCLFWKSMGLPCRHIFLPRLLTDMDLYETELCNKRWTRSYCLKNMRVVKTSSPTDSSSYCSSNQGIVTTTTDPPSKEKVVPSENQKFKKPFILAERNAALFAEVGMKEFSERLKTLQKMVELWQSNTAFNVVPKNIQEPINWIKRAQQHHGFIEEFIKSYKPKECLPVVGENIAGVRSYKDKLAFLTDDERTSLTSYLCSTYKQLRVPSSIITYIIHDTIQFITSNFTDVDGNKGNNDQEEDASTVQDKTPPP